MNTLFTSTLALVAMGTIAHATTDPKPTPTVSLSTADSDWDRLDSEISSLANTVRRPSSGTNVGALLRTYYMRSDNAAFELNNDGTSSSVNSGNELGGFDMKEADLFAEGSVAEYDWRINLDYQNSTVVLQDAFARWNYGGGVSVVVGQFKAPLLRSSSINGENLVLPDRTFAGQIFDFHDSGVMVAFDQDAFSAFLALQNGAGGKEEDMLYHARAEFSPFGGTGRVEGAFGSSGDLRASFGAMLTKDSSNGVDANAFGGDLNVTCGPVAWHAEAIHFDGEILADAGAGTSNLTGNDFLGRVMIPINYAEDGSVSDATVWSTTLSFMIEAIDVEVAGRVEAYDDPGDTRSATVGVNWYRSGKNVVWHAGVTQLNSNNPNGSPAAGNVGDEGLGDATLFQVGLSVGMSTSSL